MELTKKETEMLIVFVREGADCIHAEIAEHLIEENMTWQDAEFLKQDLGWNLQEIGGVMSSLQSKGMIEDTGEPLPQGDRPKRRTNGFIATPDGIRKVFDQI